MRVMEVKQVGAMFAVVFPDAPYEIGRIPFVDEHDIGVAQHVVHIQRWLKVKNAADKRISFARRIDGLTAVLLDEIAAAPSVARFENLDGMPAADQFARHSAKEMR